MNDLFKKRRQAQLRLLMKYLRYVFNDHFTIVLFFLLGGFLFFYSQLLQTIDQKATQFVWLAGFFLLILFPFGHLATFAKPADQYFLLPQESAMLAYLKKSFWHSVFLPIGLLLAGVVLTGPLLILVGNFSVAELIGLFLSLVFLKMIDLLFQVRANYKKEPVSRWILPLVAVLLFASLWTMIWPLMAVALLIFVFLYQKTFSNIDSAQFKTASRPLFQWDYFTQQEQARQKKIWAFIALFTDVPEVSSKISRRKYLDFLLQWIPKNQSHTYLYLFARRFVRGNEYRSLFLSLTSLAVAMMAVFSNFYGVVILTALFLYLFGFQLLPLARQFDYMTMTQLYPVDNTLKIKNFQKLLGFILVLESLLLSLLSIWFLTIAQAGILFLFLLLESFLFTAGYAPVRLKKNLA
ncbi:ABC transporter permease [Enterococcus timonensis]|uniref:ABC transporter permease n=1 Tax=Enterococcus timonensis TaxID=1852364 RepID=UPI0008D93D66|nr:ABC transporter permease [Enterococcus timonensis]